jgi:AraC family transcriptional regulator, arabinose operon regulatory protein
LNPNHELQSYTKNTFETTIMKCLLRGYNVCASDWGETDCVYGYNKFYYFQSGEATLIIHGDTYHPKSGELFMIPAKIKHTYLHNPSNPVLKYWCHFDLTFSGKQKVAYSPESIKCTPNQAEVIPLFERLIQLDSSVNPLDILSEKAILMELFKIFLENIDSSKLMPQDEDHFEAKINNYILQNLQTVITLKDMADIVHLHPNYFISFFKQHFSTSPLEYVNTLRLEKAAYFLISQPNLSMEQVAYLVGFNDYRYFGRSFKRRYGLTPSAYKGLQKPSPLR